MMGCSPEKEEGRVRSSTLSHYECHHSKSFISMLSYEVDIIMFGLMVSTYHVSHTQRIMRDDDDDDDDVCVECGEECYYIL